MHLISSADNRMITETFWVSEYLGFSRSIIYQTSRTTESTSINYPLKQAIILKQKTHFNCYVPGVTRKELGNQIMTNYYSQGSQQQALLKFNNLLRNDKIINYEKQWKICTIKESLDYSTLILSPNCPSESTHTNPSTVSDPQISKSYYNFK